MSNVLIGKLKRTLAFSLKQTFTKPLPQITLQESLLQPLVFTHFPLLFAALVSQIVLGFQGVEVASVGSSLVRYLFSPSNI